MLCRHGVDGLGQTVVELADGVARIVGAQAEFHQIVLIAEPRVVVEALGLGGYVGKEGKGRLKIGEAEVTAKAVVGFSPHRDDY